MKTSFPVSIIIEIIIVSIHCLSLNMIILLASTLARSLRDVRIYNKRLFTISLPECIRYIPSV